MFGTWSASPARGTNPCLPLTLELESTCDFVSVCCVSVTGAAPSTRHRPPVGAAGHGPLTPDALLSTQSGAHPPPPPGRRWRGTSWSPRGRRREELPAHSHACAASRAKGVAAAARSGRRCRGEAGGGASSSCAPRAQRVRPAPALPLRLPPWRALSPLGRVRREGEGRRDGANSTS
eukprot:scaffold47705_cov28-Tisochrysis_lutea.AAC.1